MLCFLKLFVIYVNYVSSTNVSANISLSGINKNGISSNNNDNVVLDYLYESSDLNQENLTDNLDLSTVDIATAKRLLQLAHTRNSIFINESEFNKTIGRERKRSNEAFYQVPYFIQKALDLMKQSIYSTRYRLQDTKELRKRYSDDICYNVAIFYGSLMQLRIKMDNVYATLMKLPYNIKFIWFLSLYERCIALNVDVAYMVEAMFKMKDKYKEFIQAESIEKGNN